MPSPFPGMDPYLEAPYIWPDIHNRLASEISAELNGYLPGPFYARLEMRPEIGIVEEEFVGRTTIVPDIAVVRHPPGARVGGVAVAEPPRREVTESLEVGFINEPIQHAFVEIRDARRDHALVTLIEILSPSNKRGGPDRSAYARKQAEVIASDASLVEIDLLRAGRRIYPDERLGEFVESLRPRPTYAVLVSEAWKREAEGMGYRVYRIGLREALPCVGIPLRAELPVVPLDLQYAFGRVYDTGPYRRGAVDYGKPPDPSLEGDDAAWAEAALREAAAPPA